MQGGCEGGVGVTVGPVRRCWGHGLDWRGGEENRMMCKAFMCLGRQNQKLELRMAPSIRRGSVGGGDGAFST